MKPNQPKFRNSITSAVLLHLLVPGLGHILWREYLFGAFVFLVTFMAAALFILSLFIPLPLLAKLVIYVLPVLFYLFSFIDLVRIVRNRTIKHPVTARRAIVILVIGVVYQAASPLAPVNFAWFNSPELFVMDSNVLAPVIREGDALKASSLAYMVKTMVVDRPIFHSLPDRFSILRFENEAGQKLCGVVLGLPGEQVEMVEGVIVIDGVPQIQPPAGAQLITGDLRLTTVDSYSLLVATARLGGLDRVYDVPLAKVIGRVDHLF